LLYTQMLDDTIPEQRQLGIDAGLAWRRVADASVVYTDLGISRGMRFGFQLFLDDDRPVEYRTLGADVTDALIADYPDEEPIERKGL